MANTMASSISKYAILVLIAVFIQRNPLLFGRSVINGNSSYTIYTKNSVLDHHLKLFANEIGDDYDAYRNHYLRVLTFAKYHCGDRCGQREIDLMALALAYHDIGLWSDHQLSYLDPSAKQLHTHANDGSNRWTDEELVTANGIVMQHHKLTAWNGIEGDEILINSVRKGDWADATIGMIRYGLPPSLLGHAYTQLPEAGFHSILARMEGRLSPDSILGQLAVLSIFKL